MDFAVSPNFVLTDKDGAEHAYIVKPHPATEGHTLAWAIQGIGTKPMLAALTTIAGVPSIQTLGSALQGEVDGDAATLMAAAGGGLIEALATLDTEPLAEALGALMSHPKLPELATQVLRYTYRDGKALGNGPGAALNYAQAYQANYGEMMQAVVRVALLNDFFPVARLFGSSSSATPVVAA